MEKEVVDSVKKVEKKLKKTYKKKDKPKIKKELKIDKTIEKKEKKQKEKKIESKEVIKSKELENKEKIDNTKTQQISNIIEDDNKVEEKLDDEKERIAIEVRELLVRNKYYPKSARRRGIEGVVKVEFLLTKDGKISSLKTFSKHNILSESLKETISRISDQFPQPKSDVLIVVNIKYSLKR
jgi:protein TonB